MPQIASRTKSKDSNASSQWLKGKGTHGIVPKDLIVNFIGTSRCNKSFSFNVV